MLRIHTAFYRAPGRLVFSRTNGLRAGSVVLKPSEVMPWHSTEGREELLIILAGRVHLETEPLSGRPVHVLLKAGQCAWLPRRTSHTVRNRSRRTARYLYVTGK